MRYTLITGIALLTLVGCVPDENEAIFDIEPEDFAAAQSLSTEEGNTAAKEECCQADIVEAYCTSPGPFGELWAEWIVGPNIALDRMFRAHGHAIYPFNASPLNFPGHDYVTVPVSVGNNGQSLAAPCTTLLDGTVPLFIVFTLPQ